MSISNIGSQMNSNNVYCNNLYANNIHGATGSLGPDIICNSIRQTNGTFLLDATGLVGASGASIHTLGQMVADSGFFTQASLDADIEVNAPVVNCDDLIAADSVICTAGTVTGGLGLRATAGGLVVSAGGAGITGTINGSQNIFAGGQITATTTLTAGTGLIATSGGANITGNVGITGGNINFWGNYGQTGNMVVHGSITADSFSPAFFGPTGPTGATGPAFALTAFLGYVTGPATITSTPAAVIFDREQYDHGDIYDNTTGICTIPALGIYTISGIVSIIEDETNDLTISIFIAGVPFYTKTIYAGTATLGAVSPNAFSFTMYLNAATTVVIVANTSASPLSIATLDYYTTLSIARLY